MDVGYIMDTWMTPWGSTIMVPRMDRRPLSVPLACGCSHPSCTTATIHTIEHNGKVVAARTQCAVGRGGQGVWDWSASLEKRAGERTALHTAPSASAMTGNEMATRSTRDISSIQVLWEATAAVHGDGGHTRGGEVRRGQSGLCTCFMDPTCSLENLPIWANHTQCALPRSHPNAQSSLDLQRVFAHNMLEDG